MTAKAAAAAAAARPEATLLRGVELGRAPRPAVAGRGAAHAASARPPRWLRPLLRVPLAAKLVGANAVVVAAAAWALFLAGAGERATAVVALALAAGVAVNYVLVRLALRPLHELESAAERVWRGDLDARVAPSPIADENMARVGGTVNRLLDGLAGDRTRMRELAAAAIEAADAERARIARELHDSTAQTLAALAMQLAAASRDSRDPDPELAERLAFLRELAGSAVEEVRALAHSVYPRVLDDLGLVAAVEWQARQVRERAALDVRVGADEAAAWAAASADRHVAAALYRVAQESLRNVERHAGARSARVALAADRGPRGRELRIEVTDDGRGFDVAEAESRRPGMGLFSMRERLGLVGGTFRVESTPGRGTRVTASVPLGDPPPPPPTTPPSDPGDER